MRGRGIENGFMLLPGDSVVQDSTTGLFWQQSGSLEILTFERAQAYVDGLNKSGYGGYTDWRLPTLEEAISLMEPVQNQADLFVDPVFDSAQYRIWTADKESASRAWYVSFDDGYCVKGVVYNGSCVRAVR